MTVLGDLIMGKDNWGESFCEAYKRADRIDEAKLKHYMDINAGVSRDAVEARLNNLTSQVEILTAKVEDLQRCVDWLINDGQKQDRK